MSADVETVQATLPAVTAPICNPEMVTVKGRRAGILAPAVVMTKDEGLVELQTPEKPTMPLLPDATVGVMDDAKKEEGYVTVIVPPAESKVDGVKINVRAADVLSAMRSATEIPNITDVI